MTENERTEVISVTLKNVRKIFVNLDQKSYTIEEITDILDKIDPIKEEQKQTE